MVFSLKFILFTAPGTGKTFIVSAVSSACKQIRWRFRGLATTGVASTQIENGSTVHNFLQAKVITRTTRGGVTEKVTDFASALRDLDALIKDPNFQVPDVCFFFSSLIKCYTCSMPTVEACNTYDLQCCLFTVTSSPVFSTVDINVHR